MTELLWLRMLADSVSDAFNAALLDRPEPSSLIKLGRSSLMLKFQGTEMTPESQSS